MNFEWDKNKAEENLRKHGVPFEQAIIAFDDPYGIVRLDLTHSAWEMRERLLGESDIGLLSVIFTIREPKNILRIISARPAKRKERKHYEESKGYIF